MSLTARLIAKYQRILDAAGYPSPLGRSAEAFKLGTRLAGLAKLGEAEDSTGRGETVGADLIAMPGTSMMLGDIVRGTEALAPTQAQKDAMDASVSGPSDVNAWATLSDLSSAGSGDMLKAVFDPTGVNADAFSRANHLGTQLALTISNFDAAVAAEINVTANSAHRNVVAGNPHGVGLSTLGTGTLAQLNTAVTDATLDDASASRPPNGVASGDLGGTYPAPSVERATGAVTGMFSLATGLALISQVTHPDLTANTNDLTVAGMGTAVVLNVDVDNGGSSVRLTGIQAPSPAYPQMLALINTDANGVGGRLRLRENDAGSLAANRFLMGGNVNLDADEGTVLLYDVAASRWRVIARP